MKKALTLTLVFLFILFTSTSLRKEAINTKISSIDVLDKCIKHYDPNGTWDSFSGKVRIKTIFPEWNNEEYLEINNGTGFYQSTILSTEEKIIRGIKDGKCIRMIGDNSDLTEDQIEDNNLSCESIKMAREHHTCHFGFVMNLKKAGIKINEDVSEDIFNGCDCYVVSFDGFKEDVISDYYLGTSKLFIDKSNFVLRGIVRIHPDYPERKRIITGELKINDIIMPNVITYYLGDSEQPNFVDIFYNVED
jgi:hypothetical protein